MCESRRAQGGGATVTTLRAHLGSAPGPKYTLEPTPEVRFSGAAVLDGAGKLVGLVQFASPDIAAADRSGAGPVAVIVPTKTIRAVLAQHAAISEAPANNTKDYTAGIVRVICTRK